MKIYIAASYPCKKEAYKTAEQLKCCGHSIVSGWIYRDEGYNDDRNETVMQKFSRMQTSAMRDFEEVRECDLLVCLTDGEKQLTHGGRHTELGIALALKKNIIIVGECEQVFHYHHCVLVLENTNCLNEYIEYIES